MISALCWLPRGAACAAEEPADIAADISEGQLEDGRAGGGSASEGSSADPDDTDTQAEVAQARAAAARLRSSAEYGTTPLQGVHAQLQELKMDQYDEEQDSGNLVQGIFGSGNPGMSYYRSNLEDPYITLRNTAGVSDSEADDNELRDTDYVILAARNEDDVSHLEIWVYEDADEDDGNLYVHHDILLPEFPLCVAWLDCPPSSSGREAGNLAAVGSMGPGIEIWNLNITDAVEPLAVLGGPLLPTEDQAVAQAEAAASQKKKKVKKKHKKQGLREGSHGDAVLGLAWNAGFRNVLASASADRQVKVWDVATLQCQHTLALHSGKVQAVAWNPAEPPVLLSGGFDHSLYLMDVRTPTQEALSWSMPADLEALAWAPMAPTTFVASSEDGLVAAFDARNGAGSPPLYRLSAHDRPTCALSFCPAVSGLLCTASTDGLVKLWDVSSQQPSLVATASNLNLGAVFSAGFCPEASWLIAAGGAKGTVAVWDITTSPAVESKYGLALNAGRQTSET